LTCSSTSLSLNYNSIGVGLSAACSIITTNNAQSLITVNKDTILGTSLLKSVTYNTATTESTPNITLSTFLYKQNVIEFISLTDKKIDFSFDGLPIHKKLIVRVRAFTECTTENTTVQITLSGSTPVVSSSVLTSNTETIIEG
jgi:hypothetical protein